jgi:hypothetical protein
MTMALNMAKKQHFEEAKIALVVSEDEPACASPYVEKMMTSVLSLTTD